MQRQVCTFYQLPTGCKYGENCRFLHTRGIRAPCQYYNTRAGCRFGSECLFSHDTTPSCRSQGYEPKNQQKDLPPEFIAAVESAKKKGLKPLTSLKQVDIDINNGEVLVCKVTKVHVPLFRAELVIEDSRGKKAQVVLYLDSTDQLNIHEPPAMIGIRSPHWHYFADGSVGFRINSSSEIMAFDEIKLSEKEHKEVPCYSYAVMNFIEWFSEGTSFVIPYPLFELQDPSLNIPPDDSMQKSKEKGNQHFNKGEWEEALNAYSKGLLGFMLAPVKPRDAMLLFSNAAAVYLKLNENLKASLCAAAAIIIDPSYDKSYYRLASALGTTTLLGRKVLLDGRKICGGREKEFDNLLKLSINVEKEHKPEPKESMECKHGVFLEGECKPCMVIAHKRYEAAIAGRFEREGCSLHPQVRWWREGQKKEEGAVDKINLLDRDTILHYLLDLLQRNDLKVLEGSYQALFGSGFWSVWLECGSWERAIYLGIFDLEMRRNKPPADMGDSSDSDSSDSSEDYAFGSGYPDSDSDSDSYPYYSNYRSESDSEDLDSEDEYSFGDQLEDQAGFWTNNEQNVLLSYGIKPWEIDEGLELLKEIELRDKYGAPIREKKIKKEDKNKKQAQQSGQAKKGPTQRVPSNGEQMKSGYQNKSKQQGEKENRRDNSRQQQQQQQKREKKKEQKKARTVSKLSRVTPAGRIDMKAYPFEFKISSGIMLWGQLNTVLAGNMTEEFDCREGPEEIPMGGGTIRQYSFEYRAAAKLGTWKVQRIFSDGDEIGFVIHHESVSGESVLQQAALRGTPYEGGKPQPNTTYINRYDWSHMACLPEEATELLEYDEEDEDEQEYWERLSGGRIIAVDAVGLPSLVQHLKDERPKLKHECCGFTLNDSVFGVHASTEGYADYDWGWLCYSGRKHELHTTEDELIGIVYDTGTLLNNTDREPRQYHVEDTLALEVPGVEQNYGW